jgi:hemolysin-activating ACP:hemolysin acyltransferase
MKKNVIQIYDQPNEINKTQASWIGFACGLMSRSKVHSKYEMLYLRKIIEPAIKHQFIKFYFNAHGESIGYVIWAFVAADVEKRFLESGTWDLHISEWNEGDQLWIIDLVAPFGNIKEILCDLRDAVFLNFKIVRYFRIKRNKSISKEIIRNNKCHFFKRAK